MINLELVKKVRKQKRISQGIVSEKLGISQSSYKRKESGDGRFFAEELEEMSKILDVPIQNFFKE